MNKDEEQQIRDDERKRMEEEKIRRSERERHGLKLFVKAWVWVVVVGVAMIAVAWVYLGQPTSGSALADAMEKATGMPLPLRH